MSTPCSNRNVIPAQKRVCWWRERNHLFHHWLLISVSWTFNSPSAQTPRDCRTRIPSCRQRRGERRKRKSEKGTKRYIPTRVLPSFFAAVKGPISTTQSTTARKCADVTSSSFLDGLDLSMSSYRLLVPVDKLQCFQHQPILLQHPSIVASYPRHSSWTIQIPHAMPRTDKSSLPPHVCPTTT